MHWGIVADGRLRLAAGSNRGPAVQGRVLDAATIPVLPIGVLDAMDLLWSGDPAPVRAWARGGLQWRGSPGPASLAAVTASAWADPSPCSTASSRPPSGWV
jgi:hypothetical protein